jgi:hypothetical protein
VLGQGAQEAALCVLGRALARVPTKVVADIHGDPAAPARLYGSPRRRRSRRWPTPSRASGCGGATASGRSRLHVGLVRDGGVEPTAEFAAFMDLEPFLETLPARFPTRPTALFVGVLERYKAVDVLADAWRLAAPRVPTRRSTRRPRHAARRATALVADLPAQTRWTESLTTPRSRARSTTRRCSCSRRGRRVSAASSSRRSAAAAASSRVASAGSGHRRGRDDRRCSSARERDALADALVRVLSDRARGAPRRAGHTAVQSWLATPADYARRIRELVDSVRNSRPTLPRCEPTGRSSS